MLSLMTVQVSSRKNLRKYMELKVKLAAETQQAEQLAKAVEKSPDHVNIS